MSQVNHDSPREKRGDAKQETRPVEPDGTSAGLCLWTWLGRPRAWSAAQVMALATLACLAAALLTVSLTPATIGVPAAWTLAALAYLLLGSILSREVVRSFRCE